VYLQLEDQAFTAMVLDGERVAWLERVPLPEGLCVDGEPKAVEALGDLLGDLLVERGYAGARVKAVLPRTATAWRVIEWPDASWPAHPELVVRQQQLELDLPWSPQDADLLLEPLLGAQPRSLLVAVQRSVLEAWIEVCNQASLALDAVEALPICLWRAVSPQFPLGEGVQVLLQLEPDQSWLLALDQGQPLGEWLMPVASDHEELSLALARWQRRYSPAAAIVLGGEPASAEALGCPASGFARVEGVPALWGLAEAELRR
jgi:Tfp pilus assembly PilM family ATPase